MANITNLPVSGPIKIGGEKVIALNQTNIDFMKKGYSTDPKIIASASAVSNKDLLSQSFATPNLNATAPQIVEPTENVVSNNVVMDTPVQITGIPTIQNGVNLESTPVNMSMESNNIPLEENKTENISMDPLSGLENMIPNTNLNISPLSNENEIPTINTTPGNNSLVEPNMSSINMPTAPIPMASVEIPSINGNANVIDSPFRVSTDSNIFDQVAVEEPKQENEVKHEVNNSNIDPLNIFETQQNSVIPPVFSNEEIQNDIEQVNNNIVSETAETIDKNDINSDILQAEITLEKETAELYEKLAKNSRKKVELLEQKRKTNMNYKNITGEPSASELFNSNGTLDDTKVLDNIQESVLKLTA